MTQSTQPAYKNPWFWLVLSPLIFAFISGMITLYLASNDFDGLVTDEYIKEGFAIHAPSNAQTLTATLHVSTDSLVLALHPKNPKHFVVAKQLQLHIVHPTRASRDIKLLLKPTEGFSYTSNFSQFKSQIQADTPYELVLRPLHAQVQSTETDSKPFMWQLKANFTLNAKEITLR